MTSWFGSLTVRLALLTSVWVTVGLISVWLWVAGIVSQAAERSFDARLIALLDAMVAVTNIDDGKPRLTRAVSEPRFDRPMSGVYYQIEGPDGAITTSRSLWDEQLPRGRADHTGILVADIPGPGGQHLRMAERDFRPPGGGGVIHILVAASIDETRAEAEQTHRALAIGFVLLGAGLVGAVVSQVSFGLSGLRRLRGAVAILRHGGDLDAHLNVPSEVRPLVTEIDALVRQNRATVERARGYVGNLAHTLRTHLSIVRNAADTGDLLSLSQELAATERLVQHHLTRARAASLTGAAATDVSMVGVADDIGRALRRLFEERNLIIEVSGDPDERVRCDREDLAEILGNLMENACKWATAQVRVTVRRSGEEIVALVSDDGPGLPPDKAAMARERGVRLDETVPGTGLGLAIAGDLLALYDGRLELESPGPDGGLGATVILPAGQRAAVRPGGGR